MLKKFLNLIDKHEITHFGGAPIVLNMITGAPESDQKKLNHKVYVLNCWSSSSKYYF